MSLRIVLILSSVAWALSGAAGEAEAEQVVSPVEAEAASPASAEDSAIPRKLGEQPLDVETILSNPLDEEAYRQRRNCLPRRGIDDVEVLDGHLVLFHERRGELWLNRLASECLGLEEDMTLDLRGYGGSFCRLDRFRGIPRFGAFAIAAECRLGSFETIDELQAQALRKAISERRQVSDMAKRTKLKAEKAK